MKIYKQFNFQCAVFFKKVEFNGSVKVLCLTQSTYPHQEIPYPVVGMGHLSDVILSTVIEAFLPV